MKYISNEYSIYYNNYIDILENLKNNFNQNDYAIFLYEEINTNKFKKKLENILNLKLNHIDFNKKVNESSNQELDEGLFEKAVPIYKEVYRYCSKYNPESKRYWKGFKIL